MPIISGTKPEEELFSLQKMLSKYDCFCRHKHEKIQIYIVEELDGWWNRLRKRKVELTIAELRSKAYGNDLSDLKVIECYGYPATCYQIACELEKQFEISITLNLSRDKPVDW